MPYIRHAKSITYADCTDSDKLRPSDWNSSHEQHWTLQGNTLGASTLSGTNIQLAGGTNISLSVAGQTVSIIGAAGGGGGVALSAGGGSVSSGTVVLSNSNNVSFGMNVSTITASASYSQSTAPAAIVASNSTWTAGSVVFSGSNNVTVNYNAGTVVISGANTHAQQTGISGIAGSGASTVTNGTLQFSNLNGVSFGLNGSTMTASIAAGATATGNLGGVAGSAASTVTNGTLVFSNLNGVSFGLNGSTMTASIQTSYAASNHSHGNPTLALTNLTGTTASNSAGLTLSLSAAAPGGGGNLTISAGAASMSNGSLVFSNSNGLSFGLNGSTITASHNALTNQSVPAQSVYLYGNTAGASTWTGSQFSLSGGPNITISVNGASVVLSGGAGAAGNTGYLSNSNSSLSMGTALFTNANGVSWSINGQTINASVETSYAASNHSHGNPTLNLTNLSGTTGSNSAGLTISLSAAAPGAGGGVALSAGTTQATSGTVVFSNSNSISFGMNGQTITASGAFADAMVTLTAGNNMSLSASTNGVSATITFNNVLSSSATAVGVNSVSSAGTLSSRFALADHQHALVFSNSNGVSFGWNAGTVTASVGAAPAAGVAAIAGSAASSVTSGTMQFANSNGVSFGLNGSTMTASILDPNRAGTGTTYAGANITGAITLNTNGLNLSLSVDNYLTTAAQVSHSHGNPSLYLTNLTGTTGSNSNGFSLSLSGNPAGGGGFTKSIKVLGEDFIGFNTGSNFSSHAVGSIWFNPVHMDAPISISNLFVVKSFGMSLSTSSNSSGRQSISYAHTWWLFRRSDFAANSQSLTYQTSGSWGLSFSRSHTSNNNSITVSWITDSTGGTSSWSSASAGVGLSSYWTGARHIAIPMVTSLSQGEWFIAHQHSATYANVNSTSSFCPISNYNWSLQANTVIPIGGITGQLRWNAWQVIGFGRATAITTNAVMNGSAISAESFQYWHGVMANLGIVS